MSNCGACNILLSTEGDCATCSACKQMYHFECSTLKAISWRTMGPRRRGAWRCTACKSKKSSDRGEESELELEDDNEEDDSDDVAEKNREKELWDGVLEKVKDPIVRELMVLFDRRFNKLEINITKIMKDTEKKLSKKLEEFENNLNFYGDKVEDATESVKNMEKKLVLTEKKMEICENENMEFKTRLRNLEIQLIDTAQQQYNDKIEISGFQENVDETDVTSKILGKAGFTTGDVEYKVLKIQRVGEDKIEKQSIVVQFRSQEMRNTVMTKIKKEKIYTKLQGILKNEKSSIYINESLSPYNKNLLFEANKLKKEKGYSYLWVKDGKILLKKTDTSDTIIKIKCLADLGKI